MNWLDFNFIVLGPGPIWALVLAVVFLAVAVLKLSKVMMTELKGMRGDIQRGSKGLEKVSGEISGDNVALKEATFELTEDVRQLREILTQYYGVVQDGLNFMRKLYFWIPAGGDASK